MNPQLTQGVLYCQLVLDPGQYNNIYNFRIITNYLVTILNYWTFVLNNAFAYLFTKNLLLERKFTNFNLTIFDLIIENIFSRFRELYFL